jgi:hypothetical protein
MALSTRTKMAQAPSFCGSARPSHTEQARFAGRTGADHITTVDGGDAPMGLLPEAITLALLLALGRQ